MSSATNPYAGFLGDQDPLEVIGKTPERLNQLFNKLGANGQEKTYAPGKWSAREILCHLADCEIVFAFRLRQALAEPHHMIQPFDQDEWAKMYSGAGAHEALDVFVSVRQWNLRLLASAPPDAFTRVL